MTPGDGRTGGYHVDRIDECVVDMEEAVQNHVDVFQLAEKYGHVVVMKDGRPRYMVIDLERKPQIEMTEDEKLEFVARRILREHHAAFTELAK